MNMLYPTTAHRILGTQEMVMAGGPPRETTRHIRPQSRSEDHAESLTGNTLLHHEQAGPSEHTHSTTGNQLFDTASPVTRLPLDILS